MDDQHLIEEAASMINRAQRLVAFSGAGMSAESGIPTFRDPGGLWDRYDPGELGGGDLFTSLLAGSGVPEAITDFFREMLTVFERAKPNPGHLALAELEKIGILRSVITQNIDNLHYEAGNTTVVEVHGNVYRLACLSCGKRSRLNRDSFLSLGRRALEAMERMDLKKIMNLASVCPCGGFSRLDVVAFGEPVQDFTRAISESANCDLFLILGTSGVVYPAASLPSYALKAGAKVIEINATDCAFPEMVDLFILGKTGEVLPRIVEVVRELRASRS
jgi:NAD-dependent deacetylase